MDNGQSGDKSSPRKPIRCINLDWLEVYCTEPSDKFPLNADYFRDCGYVVSERDYGTRVYREMFTIEDEHGQGFIEVRRNPASNTANDGGLFPPESCHLRLTNYACYAPNPIDNLRSFMVKHGYTLVRIFRIDIALDFTRFDMGDEPARFVRRYLEGKYAKVNQGHISAHGDDTWQARRFNSLSWGAPKSMVSTKMYDKTLELSQAHDKPYIRYNWFLAGLIDNPVTGEKRNVDGTVIVPSVWRVEFSIKSSAKKWFVMENCNLHKRTNVYMPHTLDMYDTKEKLVTMFASLCNYYFHFKVYEEGKRKDRCRDKVLFQFSPNDIVLRPDRQASDRPVNSKLARLEKYLVEYRFTTYDEKTIQAIDTILHVLRSQSVHQFAGNQFTAEDILILQRLIAERTGEHGKGNLTEQKREIATLVHSFFGESW